MSGITNLVNHINLPKFVRAHQKFDDTELSQSQILEILFNGFEKDSIRGKIKKGQRICITCGSRGVSNMTFVTKVIVEHIKALGAYPVLVPAMGSHGGATAQGQIEILKSLGITEDSMGCSILSSMETVKVGHVETIEDMESFDVCIDKNAYECDGIIVLNRIKAHTSFQGDYESGLMKMLTIGLGKQYGAYMCHSKGDDNMAQRIGLNGREVIKNTNIIMGIALLENAFDKTCDIKVLTDKEIIEEEPKLLIKAKNCMGRIWFDNCDVLIVGTLGKNFTGAGMDPNIVGRSVNSKLKMGINAQRIGIFDLSAESHGNATGMGRADLATKKFFDKVSFDDTYPNFITSYDPTAFRIPIIVDSQEEVMKTCVASALNIDYDNPRIIIIKNSLEIENILISEVMMKEARLNCNIELLNDEPFQLEFNKEGKLLTSI